jgi:hypothetical protein
MARVQDPGGLATVAVVPCKPRTTFAKNGLGRGVTIQAVEPVNYTIEGRGIGNRGLYQEAVALEWRTERSCHCSGKE